MSIYQKLHYVIKIQIMIKLISLNSFQSLNYVCMRMLNMNKSTPINKLPLDNYNNTDHQQQQQQQQQQQLQHTIEQHNIEHPSHSSQNDEQNVIDINKLSSNYEMNNPDIMTHNNTINNRHDINLQNQLNYLQNELRNMQAINNDCPGGVCELKKPIMEMSSKSNNEQTSYFNMIEQSFNIKENEIKQFLVILVCYLLINVPNIQSMLFDKIYDHIQNEHLILLIRSVIFSLILFVFLRQFK